MVKYYYISRHWPRALLWLRVCMSTDLIPERHVYIPPHLPYIDLHTISFVTDTQYLVPRRHVLWHSKREVLELSCFLGWLCHRILLNALNIMNFDSWDCSIIITFLNIMYFISELPTQVSYWLFAYTIHFIMSQYVPTRYKVLCIIDKRCRVKIYVREVRWYIYVSLRG